MGKNKEDIEILEKKLHETDDPEEIREIVVQEMISRTKSGPLPDPEDFKKYEEVLPGSADRIMTMAENNQENRLELQKIEQEKYYNSNDKITSKGITSSTIISIAGISGAVLLGIFGNEYAASIIGALSLGNIVVNMINSTVNTIRRK